MFRDYEAVYGAQAYGHDGGKIGEMHVEFFSSLFPLQKNKMVLSRVLSSSETIG